MDTLRRHADRDRGIADDAPNAVPVKASKVSDGEAAEFYQRQVRWRDSVDSKRQQQRASLAKQAALESAWVEEDPERATPCGTEPGSAGKSHVQEYARGAAHQKHNGKAANPGLVASEGLYSAGPGASRSTAASSSSTAPSPPQRHGSAAEQQQQQQQGGPITSPATVVSGSQALLRHSPSSLRASVEMRKQWMAQQGQGRGQGSQSIISGAGLPRAAAPYEASGGSGAAASSRPASHSPSPAPAARATAGGAADDQPPAPSPPSSPDWRWHMDEEGGLREAQEAEGRAAAEAMLRQAMQEEGENDGVIEGGEAERGQRQDKREGGRAGSPSASSSSPPPHPSPSPSPQEGRQSSPALAAHAMGSTVSAAARAGASRREDSPSRRKGAARAMHRLSGLLPRREPPRGPVLPGRDGDGDRDQGDEGGQPSAGDAGARSGVDASEQDASASAGAGAGDRSGLGQFGLLSTPAQAQAQAGSRLEVPRPEPLPEGLGLREVPRRVTDDNERLYRENQEWVHRREQELLRKARKLVEEQDAGLDFRPRTRQEIGREWMAKQAAGRSLAQEREEAERLSPGVAGAQRPLGRETVGPWNLDPSSGRAGFGGPTAVGPAVQGASPAEQARAEREQQQRDGRGTPTPPRGRTHGAGTRLSLSGSLGGTSGRSSRQDPPRDVTPPRGAQGAEIRARLSGTAALRERVLRQASGSRLRPASGSGAGAGAAAGGSLDHSRTQPTAARPSELAAGASGMRDAWRPVPESGPFPYLRESSARGMPWEWSGGDPKAGAGAGDVPAVHLHGISAEEYRAAAAAAAEGAPHRGPADFDGSASASSPLSARMLSSASASKGRGRGTAASSRSSSARRPRSSASTPRLAAELLAESSPRARAGGRGVRRKRSRKAAGAGAAAWSAVTAAPAPGRSPAPASPVRRSRSSARGGAGAGAGGSKSSLSGRSSPRSPPPPLVPRVASFGERKAQRAREIRAREAREAMQNEQRLMFNGSRKLVKGLRKKKERQMQKQKQMKRSGLAARSAKRAGVSPRGMRALDASASETVASVALGLGGGAQQGDQIQSSPLRALGRHPRDVIARDPPPAGSMPGRRVVRGKGKRKGKGMEMGNGSDSQASASSVEVEKSGPMNPGTVAPAAPAQPQSAPSQSPSQSPYQSPYQGPGPGPGPGPVPDEIIEQVLLDASARMESALSTSRRAHLARAQDALAEADALMRSIREQRRRREDGGQGDQEQEEAGGGLSGRHGGLREGRVSGDGGANQLQGQGQGQGKLVALGSLQEGAGPVSRFQTGPSPAPSSSTPSPRGPPMEGPVRGEGSSQAGRETKGASATADARSGAARIVSDEDSDAYGELARQVESLRTAAAEVQRSMEK